MVLPVQRQHERVERNEDAEKKLAEKDAGKEGASVDGRLLFNHGDYFERLSAKSARPRVAAAWEVAWKEKVVD